MPYYIICGKPDCKHFAHATYVAQYLNEHLPNFKYRKVEKSQREWPMYVNSLNKANTWFCTKSPIIWKEISTWGGKPHLLGGLSEFWEHCYCYYGLESNIPKSDLEKLTLDNIKFFNEEKQRMSNEQQNYYITIGILGALNWMVPYLLYQLVDLPELKKTPGILIKLFDPKLEDKDPNNPCEDVEGAAEDINDLCYFGLKETVRFVDSIKDCVEGTDLLLDINEYPQSPEETEAEYLIRVKEIMSSHGYIINAHANRNMKVILVNGPVCFAATCLVEFCVALNVGNIVALTADLGLPVLNVIHDLTDVPIHQMSAAPVWGFVGMNSFINERAIIFKANIYRPYRRALTAPPKSTLPLGTVVPEIRMISYMLPDQHEEVTKMVNERKDKEISKLGRYPYQPKIRALVSLIKIWHAEKDQDAIISLGVCSTGAFDIPLGLVFSQPASLDDKKRWRPFADYPLYHVITQSHMKVCVEKTMDALNSIGFTLKNNDRVCEGSTMDNTPRHSDMVIDTSIKLSVGSNKRETSLVSSQSQLDNSQRETTLASNKNESSFENVKRQPALESIKRESSIENVKRESSLRDNNKRQSVEE